MAWASGIVCDRIGRCPNNGGGGLPLLRIFLLQQGREGAERGGGSGTPPSPSHSLKGGPRPPSPSHTSLGVCGCRDHDRPAHHYQASRLSALSVPRCCLPAPPPACHLPRGGGGLVRASGGGAGEGPIKAKHRQTIAPRSTLDSLGWQIGDR